MSFVKRYLFWLCAGAVLLGEIYFAAFPLRGVYGTGEQLESAVEAKRSSLSRALKGPLANEESIHAAREYKLDLERSYFELLLLLMQRDADLSHMEPPVADPTRLVASGERAKRMAQYIQRTRELRAQAQQAGIMLSSPISIDEADWSGQVPVASDLVSAFKILWLQKACVQAMMPREGQNEPLVGMIRQMAFGKNASSIRSGELTFNPGPGDKPEYYRLLFFVDVSMPFAHVPEFMSRLAADERIIDVRAVEVKRAAPLAMAAATGEDEAMATAQDKRWVQAFFVLEAVDFVVDIHKVTFARKQFPTTEETAQWINTFRLQTRSAPKAERFFRDRLRAVQPVESEADNAIEYTLRAISPDFTGFGGQAEQLEIADGVTVYLGRATSPEF